MTHSNYTNEIPNSKKTIIHMPLARVLRLIQQGGYSKSLESLSTGIRMWILHNIKDSFDLKGVILCVDAEGAPESFNYLSLIRALTETQEDKDFKRLAVAGLVVGGVPYQDQYTSSVISAFDIIAQLTKMPYLLWSDMSMGEGTPNEVPKMRGVALTGTGAILVNTIFNTLLVGDPHKEFTYKDLINEVTPGSAAASSLKSLHNKYPGLLEETRIEVPRSGNKGLTSSYTYKLIGYKSHEQAPCYSP